MSDSNKSTDVSRLLYEVMRLVRSNMSKHNEDFGVTGPQGLVMRVLGRNGQMKVSELSDMLCLSNSTVSGILDRLEKLEFIERNRSSEDRRVVYVSLSPKFQTIHADFHKKAEDSIKNIILRASPEEIEKLIEGLNILKKLLGKQ